MSPVIPFPVLLFYPFPCSTVASADLCSHGERQVVTSDSEI